MKKLVLFTLFAGLAMPQIGKADIVIAGLDAFSSNSAPAVTVTGAGVDTTVALVGTGGNWGTGENNSRGSTPDGTWGTFAGPAAASTVTTTTTDSNLSLTNGKPAGTITLTLVNNGAADVALNDFHFDAVAFRRNAARTWAVSVLAGSDITVGNLFTSDAPLDNNSTNAITQLNGGLTNGGDQHDDINLSDFVSGGLSSLADNVLEVGGSAIVELAFSNGTGSGGGHHLFVDNIAVSGDVVAVPEPSSLALLGLAGMLGLVRRRK